MKLLNLCCGATRPQSTPSVEWVNIDNLYATLLPGTPERDNLNMEGNYINMDVESELFDFSRKHVGYFDGIIASHCVEHWDCQTAAKIMTECHMLLKNDGCLVVSVPDASYFRQVYEVDCVDKAEELFGEPIHLPDGETTFFGYGLWNRFHKAILTEDALWCYLKRAGFGYVTKVNSPTKDGSNGIDPLYEVMTQLNRLAFSLVMVGLKE